MKSWFPKRGYPEHIIDFKMEKVSIRENKIKKLINIQKGVPLVVTCHPKFKSLSWIIKEKPYLAHVNDDVKKTFTISPMISFRKSCNISSDIVRVKLHLLERTVGSQKCSKKCWEVCDMISITDTFSSTVTDDNFKKLIISLILKINVLCTQLHVRYVINSTLVRLQTALHLGGIAINLGVESLMRIKDVCKNIFTVILKVRDITVSWDVSITLTDKTDGFDPMKRETFWMHTLKIFVPYGLNTLKMVF